MAAACAKDRFAYFPNILASGPSPNKIVIWGLRPAESSLGVHESAIRSIIARNSGLQLERIVGFPTAETVAIDDWPYSRYADFFENPPKSESTLVVDRSCTWRDETPDSARLQALGFSVVRFEQFLNAPIFLSDGYYRAHSDYLLSNYKGLMSFVDVFADEKSKCVYLQSLMALISMNYEFFHANLNPYEHRYVPDDINRPLRADEVFVDCGAFDGMDSIGLMQRVNFKFRSVHVFEPENVNYVRTVDAIQKVVTQHCLQHVYPYRIGVSDVNKYVSFAGDGQGVTATGNSIDTGKGIFVGRLDDVISNATWIKLEVEGSELAALRGAASLIHSCRPTISVSVYHKPEDYLELIPYLLNSLTDYNYYLRHSGLEPGTLCMTAVPREAQTGLSSLNG